LAKRAIQIQRQMQIRLRIQTLEPQQCHIGRQKEREIEGVKERKEGGGREMPTLSPVVAVVVVVLWFKYSPVLWNCSNFITCNHRAYRGACTGRFGGRDKTEKKIRKKLYYLQRRRV